MVTGEGARKGTGKGGGRASGREGRGRERRHCQFQCFTTSQKYPESQRGLQGELQIEQGLQFSSQIHGKIPIRTLWFRKTRPPSPPRRPRNHFPPRPPPPPSLCHFQTFVSSSLVLLPPTPTSSPCVAFQELRSHSGPTQAGSNERDTYETIIVTPNNPIC